MRLALVVVLAALAFTGSATAQRADDRAAFDARMNVLERTLSDLSIQIERLRVSDQQLQQQLERMRTSYGERLEMMEKGTLPKATAPQRPKP
jgi:FKBP-type peptidyl-prolyl cis-trans isomerase (trigger factor)